MRNYETIYIANPNLEQEALTRLIEETKAIVKKRGGELLYEEILGKKRLAYAVQKQRFGTYVLLQFQSDGAGNVRINQDLELNENILAHMVVRIEEDEIREARAEIPVEKQAAIESKEPAEEVAEDTVPDKEGDSEAPAPEEAPEELSPAEATAPSEEEAQPEPEPES